MRTPDFPDEEPSRDELEALIGCDEVVSDVFDLGRALGMTARWNTQWEAVRWPTTGRKPHRSNPDWTQSYPTRADYVDAAAKLKAAH